MRRRARGSQIAPPNAWAVTISTSSRPGTVRAMPGTIHTTPFPNHILPGSTEKPSPPPPSFPAPGTTKGSSEGLGDDDAAGCGVTAPEGDCVVSGWDAEGDVGGDSAGVTDGPDVACVVGFAEGASVAPEEAVALGLATGNGVGGVGTGAVPTTDIESDAASMPAEQSAWSRELAGQM